MISSSSSRMWCERVVGMVSCIEAPTRGML